MKRSGFKKKIYKPMKRTPLKAKKGFKINVYKNNWKHIPSLKTLKRTKLRLEGHSETSIIKREIQAVLRQIAIKRDKGCILAKYPETGACGGYKNTGELVLQGEHLNSRAFNVSFADSRNIVCLCYHHHMNWKPQHSKLYWEIIQKEIGPKRWAWLKRVEQDKRIYKYDWKLALLALQQELKKIESSEYDVINY